MEEHEGPQRNSEVRKDGRMERPRTKSTVDSESTEEIESMETIETTATIESTAATESASRTSTRHSINKGEGTFKVPTTKPKSKNVNSLKSSKGKSHSTNHSSQDDEEVSTSDSDDNISLSELRKKHRGKSQISDTTLRSNESTGAALVLPAQP